MGNSQASHEISLEELERFEMEVDEEFNPSGELSERAAKREYMVKVRAREAEALRQKYLGNAVAKQASKQVKGSGPPAGVCPFNGHHLSRDSFNAKVKPRFAGKVTYVFQDQEAGDKDGGDGQGKEEEGDSLSEILQQKERIRSLITPGEPEKNAGCDALGLQKKDIANNDGRSPYQGAQLRVVSVNHRKQGENPIFER